MRASELLPAGARLVVLSPHLDDAAFSLGATLAGLARAKVKVSVVTVFAGDPDSPAPAGEWDRRAGFRTEGEAARARREEDLHACRVMGAEPVWLPFRDEQYAGRDDDALREALEPLLAGADALLTPGFPLVHRDHERLTRLVLGVPGLPGRVGLYVEQPYATWHRDDLARPELMGSPAVLAGTSVIWSRIEPGLAGFVSKQRALRAYPSQLRAMVRPLQRVPLAVGLYELRRGGEAVAWVDRALPRLEARIEPA